MLLKQKQKQSNGRSATSSRLDVRFRPYRGEEDIASIAEIAQRSFDAQGIEYLWSREEAARLFAYLNHFNPFKNVLLAEAADDVIGFVRVHWRQEEPGPRIYHHTGHVLPQWQHKGIGLKLLQFAQKRLRTLAKHHRCNGSRFFQTWSTDSDTSSKTMLDSDGYQPIRYDFDMLRPLTKEIEPRALPPGLEVRPIQPKDYRLIWEASDEAFRDHWGYSPATESSYEWWQKGDSFQPDLWKVAWDGDQVAGMVLNFIDHAENKSYGRKCGYTENICIRRPWRRRGLARALLTQSLLMLKEKGMREARLGVDTQNPNGALQLYESVGFKSIKRYTTYRKEIDWAAPN
jgi:mycothiol synthase